MHHKLSTLLIGYEKGIIFPRLYSGVPIPIPYPIPTYNKKKSKIKYSSHIHFVAKCIIQSTRLIATQRNPQSLQLSQAKIL